VLSQLADPAGLAAAAADDLLARAAEALAQPGAVILAGERLAEVPGALAAAVGLAELTGARLAWIPRRAGERGAVEAGALPALLPGGRLVADVGARAEVARAWGAGSLPAEPGRDTGQILQAVAEGHLAALLVGGVDPADLPDPQAALDAIERAEFVVSLELRASAVTDRADVVFPVAAVPEKAGTFVNWEGRPGEFGTAIRVPGMRADLQVLTEIADAMDIRIGLPDQAAARRELAALGAGRDDAVPRPVTPAGRRSESTRRPRREVAGGTEASLATWHNLLDAGRMQDGEPNLAETARVAVARMSAATAAQAGTGDGAKVTVTTARGSITVPVRITAMPDGVVWLPTNSAGCHIRRDLGAGHGSIVTVSAPGSDPGSLANRSAQ
jgi:NADH-quinone oxidoreductase subunit G